MVVKEESVVAQGSEEMRSPLFNKNVETKLCSSLLEYRRLKKLFFYFFRIKHI